MPKYLYIFCYQTPAQRAHLPEAEFRDESCEAVFIEAESQEKALDWGRRISESYVKNLFSGEDVSWGQQSFAHWIEAEPQNEYPADVLERLPAVAYGVFPQFLNQRSI